MLPRCPRLPRRSSRSARRCQKLHLNTPATSGALPSPVPRWWTAAKRAHRRRRADRKDSARRFPAPTLAGAESRVSLDASIGVNANSQKFGISLDFLLETSVAACTTGLLRIGWSRLSTPSQDPESPSSRSPRSPRTRTSSTCPPCPKSREVPHDRVRPPVRVLHRDSRARAHVEERPRAPSLGTPGRSVPSRRSRLRHTAPARGSRCRSPCRRTSCP